VPKERLALELENIQKLEEKTPRGEEPRKEGGGGWESALNTELSDIMFEKSSTQKKALGGRRASRPASASLETFKRTDK